MKKIILIILMMFPFFVNGACDNNLREEGKELATHITNEISYNSAKNSFTLTLYNLSEGMRVVNSKKTYTPKDGKISISDISEGSTVRLDIYYNDGCDGQIDIIKKTMPYYNRYYNSVMCNGYEDKLYACSTQFTSYFINEEILSLAIENYETQRIPVEQNPEIPVDEEPTILQKTKEIVDKWGIRIALLIGSSLITIIIGSSLYRKEVHGV